MKRIYLLLPLLLAAAAPAQDTDCVTRSDLADYALLSDLAAYTPLSVLASYVTSADLAGYALLSDLAAYTPLSALAGYVTSADLAGYALLSDLSAYAPLSALDDCVTSADLANYATASDLAAATAAASNSFLHASPSTVGSNTYWHVSTRTVFDSHADFHNGLYVMNTATFADDGVFEGDAVFVGTATLGGETRTNWPGSRSRTVQDGDSAWIDDGLVWTIPDESDVSIYLANLSDVPNAAYRAHTVVVRNIGTEVAVVTEVYDGTYESPVLMHALTPTNPTAVFDWYPDGQAWLLR